MSAPYACNSLMRRVAFLVVAQFVSRRDRPLNFDVRIGYLWHGHASLYDISR